MPGAMHKQCATHMPDALHERTDGLTYAEAWASQSRNLRSRNARGAAYLVRWPEARFVKVGWTTNRYRWRSFIPTGGRLLAIATNRPDVPHLRYAGAERLETEMHLLLEKRLGRFFASRQEAAHYLRGGDGWTECFPDDGSALPLFTRCAEVLVWRPDMSDGNYGQLAQLRHDLWDPR